eukprot:m.40900 g.40900  ORF g.40900 m.40900 type:complete len:729 (-) comp18645_c0_seq1:72-2258(-)
MASIDGIPRTHHGAGVMRTRGQHERAQASHVSSLAHRRNFPNDGHRHHYPKRQFVPKTLVVMVALVFCCLGVGLMSSRRHGHWRKRNDIAMQDNPANPPRPQLRISNEQLSQRQIDTHNDNQQPVKTDELPELQLILVQTGDAPAAIHNKEHYVRQSLMSGSSVWCTGNTFDTRQCRFRNLCHHRMTSEYVFIQGPSSVMHGVPRDRFMPQLISMSSVQNHNAMHMTFVDLPVAALTTMIESSAVHFVNSSTFMMKRFKPNNVMHVLHDDIFPLHATLRSLPKSNLALVMMDGVGRMRHPNNLEWLYESQSSHLPLFDVDFPPNGLVCFDETFIGVSKATTWYDYGFFEPQRPISNRSVNIATEIRLAVHDIMGSVQSRLSRAQALRDTTPTGLQLDTRLDVNVDVDVDVNGDVGNDNGDNGDLGIVVFSRSRNRLILNQQQLCNVLQARFDRPVTVLTMENHTFEEQVDVLRRSMVAVGMHGSALAMAAFLPRGATLVELFPYAVPPENYTPYKTMAGELGLRYVAWANLVAGEGKNIAHPHRSAEQGGISQLPLQLQQQITGTSRVPSHICCSDPFWLFRIYQDTHVDVVSLLMLINTVLSRPKEAPPYAQSHVGQPQRQGLRRDMRLGLAPAKVVGPITCVYQPVDDGTTALWIRWPAVWNSQWMDELVYVVHLQELSTSWQTHKPQIRITAPTISRRVYRVWLRTTAKGIVGPLSAPFTCTPTP